MNDQGCPSCHGTGRGLFGGPCNLCRGTGKNNMLESIAIGFVAIVFLAIFIAVLV